MWSACGFQKSRPHLPYELHLRCRGSCAGLLLVWPESVADLDATAVALAYFMSVQFAEAGFDPGRIFPQYLHPLRCVEDHPRGMPIRLQAHVQVKLEPSVGEQRHSLRHFSPRRQPAESNPDADGGPKTSFRRIRRGKPGSARF